MFFLIYTFLIMFLHVNYMSFVRPFLIFLLVLYHIIYRNKRCSKKLMPSFSL